MDTYQFSQVHRGSAVSFSPGSTFIAAASGNQVTVTLAASLEAVKRWECGDAVDSIAWNGGGSRLLAHAGRISSAWVFDLTGESPLCTLSNVEKVAWGGEDVIAWSDRGLSIHNVETGKSRFIQNVRNGPSWSPDKKYLATVERHAGKDYVGVYDREALIRHFPIPTAETAGVSWSPCGKWLAVWDWRITYSLYIYSPVGAQLGHFEPQSLGGIEAVNWSPDGRHLLIADSEGYVSILECESWSPIASLGFTDSAAWFESSGEKLCQFVRGSMPLARAPIAFSGFNAQGDMFFFGHDNLVQIYSFGERIAPHSGIVFSHHIRSIAWCPKHDRLGITTRNSTLYLWDNFGAEGVDLPEDGFLLEHLRWSPDGKAIALSGRNEFVVVYDEAEATNGWEEV